MMIYLLFFVLNISIKADIEVINVDTYKQIYNYIQSYISNNTINTSDILFVTDIDNVIMTYDTDVGTDQWNNWQFDMIDECDKNAVTDSFTEFLDIISKMHKRLRTPKVTSIILLKGFWQKITQCQTLKVITNLFIPR